MLRSSVEVVREHIEAFRAQDTPRAISLLDPHVIWDGSRLGAVDAVGPTHGPESLAESVRRFRGAFEGYDWEVESLADLGAGAVLAVVTEVGSGRISGVPVHRSLAVLYTVIDGLIARITVFLTEQDARIAVGLD